MFQVSTTTRLQRRGFTLQELLCVLALLVAAAVVVPFTFRQSLPHSSKDVAQRHVDLLHKAVALYVADLGVCPTTSEALNGLLIAPTGLAGASQWQGPYLEKPQLPLDPWSNAFRYEALSDTEFRVWSLGPDGQSGTRDDIESKL